MKPEIQEWLDSIESHAIEQKNEAQRIIDAVQVLRDTSAGLLTPQPSSTQEIREAALEVLRRRGAPLHRKEVFHELLTMGIWIKGKDPVASLGALLSRFGKDFQSCGDGRWDLKQQRPAPRSTGEGHIRSSRSISAEADARSVPSISQGYPAYPGAESNGKGHTLE